MNERYKYVLRLGLVIMSWSCLERTAPTADFYWRFQFEEDGLVDEDLAC